jgi:hypothetical protein
VPVPPLAFASSHLRYHLPILAMLGSLADSCIAVFLGILTFVPHNFCSAHCDVTIIARTRASNAGCTAEPL